jgi:hypothetical protein
MNHPLRLNEHLLTQNACLELSRVFASHPFVNDSLAFVQLSDATGVRNLELHPGATFRLGETTGFLASVDISDPSTPVCVFHLD